MLNELEPVNLEFHIPATDPLGKEEVFGRIRFCSNECRLYWNPLQSVFRDSGNEMQCIKLSYEVIDSVKVEKKWFSAPRVCFRVSQPELVNEIPGVKLGNIKCLIDKRSLGEFKRLKRYVDFKKSLFLFEQSNTRLEEMRKD